MVSSAPAHLSESAVRAVALASFYSNKPAMSASNSAVTALQEMRHNQSLSGAHIPSTTSRLADQHQDSFHASLLIRIQVTPQLAPSSSSQETQKPQEKV